MRSLSTKFKTATILGILAVAGIVGLSKGNSNYVAMPRGIFTQTYVFDKQGVCDEAITYFLTSRMPAATGIRSKPTEDQESYCREHRI